MKKLGKKQHETIETVEAYGRCSGRTTCDCEGRQYYSNNDWAYGGAFMRP